MRVVVLAVLFDVWLEEVDAAVGVAVGAALLLVDAAFTDDVALPESDASATTASWDEAAVSLVPLPLAPARISARSGRKLRMLAERMPERIRR